MYNKHIFKQITFKYKHTCTKNFLRDINKLIPIFNYRYCQYPVFITSLIDNISPTTMMKSLSL